MSMKPMALVLFGGLLWASPAWSAMTLGNYSAARHDRFYTESDRAFLAEGLNWSGVARPTNVSRWATMIAPSFFLSANHWRPEAGDTIRFYYNNDSINGGFEDRTVIGGTRVGTSDVWVGQLSSSVSSRVTTYALVDNSSVGSNPDPLIGHKMWQFGQNNASFKPINQTVGRNIIVESNSSQISHNWNEATGYGTLGQDEALAVSGDSGSPAFIMINGQPVLVGERYTGTNTGSVAYITSQIQNYVSTTSSGTQSVRTVAIPSHTSIPVLRQTFQNDTVNMAPKVGDQAIQLVKSGTMAIAGSGGTYSDPFGGAGNQSLRMLASSSHAASSLFLEGLQTGVIQGQCLIDILVKTSGHSSSNTMFNLLIGHDYYGDTTLNTNTSQYNESILDISLQRDGHLSIKTADGTFVSDQALEFDQKHQVQVLWRSQGSSDTYGDILMDGRRITSNGGSATRFKLKNLGNSSSDTDRIDSILLTSTWNSNDGDSEIYVDNLYLLDIPEPASISLLVGAFGLLAARRTAVPPKSWPTHIPIRRRRLNQKCAI